MSHWNSSIGTEDKWLRQSVNPKLTSQDNTHLTVDNGGAAAQHAVGSIIYKRLLLLHGSRDSSDSLNCACGDSVSGGGRGAVLPGRRATMGGWTWPFLGQAAQA